MRAATEGSLPLVMPQGNLVEVLGREVRQGSPGELMVESTPSRQRGPPCKTNKEKSEEAADAAALTYLLTALCQFKSDLALCCQLLGDLGIPRHGQTHRHSSCSFVQRVRVCLEILQDQSVSSPAQTSSIGRCGVNLAKKTKYSH